MSSCSVCRSCDASRYLLDTVVCVFGIVRVVAVAQAPAGDPSYNQVWSGVWSFCEMAITTLQFWLPDRTSPKSRALLSI
ncbi:hypothetical protein HD806DRAFT_541003 [Xylariaceae sp. AK1471]|nr:hypothetical protein HD806DRAFT_541003 [Xylariaceae sp. AK1471]